MVANPDGGSPIPSEPSEPRAPRDRRRRGAIAVSVGLLACSGVVWQSSHATFTSYTENDANTVGAGTVVLTDNDSNAVLITASNLIPCGAAQTACIGVEYTGTIAPSRSSSTSPRRRSATAWRAATSRGPAAAPRRWTTT